MVHAIRMPKPGQMTEECVVTAWHKNEGDPVRRGDILFEIETDKSAMEVESFENGILLRRLVAEGDVVPVNAICAYIGEAGEAIPADEPVTAAGGTTARARSRGRTGRHSARLRPSCPHLLRGGWGGSGAPSRCPSRLGHGAPRDQPAGEPARRRGRHRPAHRDRDRAGWTDRGARRQGSDGGG